MTFEITYQELWTSDPETEGRGSLRLLSEENNHIHGVLRIVVAGRELPSLGFFGPDDVCFNTWIAELLHARLTLGQSDPATYIFDEGEQGQPAFHFEREEQTVFVSIRASEISDRRADPDWQRVPCELAAFLSHIAEFAHDFRLSLVDELGGERADSWWHALGLERSDPTP